MFRVILYWVPFKIAHPSFRFYIIAVYVMSSCSLGIYFYGEILVYTFYSRMCLRCVDLALSSPPPYELIIILFYGDCDLIKYHHARPTRPHFSRFCPHIIFLLPSLFYHFWHLSHPALISPFFGSVCLCPFLPVAPPFLLCLWRWRYYIGYRSSRKILWSE